MRTGFLTLHTADTAVFAVLTCLSALIVIGALYYNADSIVYKMDNTVGTLSYTDAATDTLLRVNTCNAVLDLDSVLGTNCRAVAVAKTSVVADSVTAVSHVSGKTGLVALVFVFLFYYVASAVAGYESNLFYNVLCLKSENGCDLLGSAVTAGNTEVGFACYLVSKSLCIAVASGVAASAAVSAGKTVTDSESGFILFDSEEHRCNREKHGTNKSYT